MTKERCALVIPPAHVVAFLSLCRSVKSLTVGGLNTAWGCLGPEKGSGYAKTK